MTKKMPELDGDISKALPKIKGSYLHHEAYPVLTPEMVNNIRFKFCKSTKRWIDFHEDIFNYISTGNPMHKETWRYIEKYLDIEISWFFNEKLWPIWYKKRVSSKFKIVPNNSFFKNLYEGKLFYLEKNKMLVRVK